LFLIGKVDSCQFFFSGHSSFVGHHKSGYLQISAASELIFFSKGFFMKLSKIALATLLATGVVAASAASKVVIPKVECKMDTAVEMVNTCAPEATLYVAGSSALGGAIAKVVPGLFDSPAKVAIVLDGGSKNGYAVITPGYNDVSGDQAPNAVSAFYGLLNKKRTLIVYNGMNGSAAGVSQLMATSQNFSNLKESDVVTVGPTLGPIKGGTYPNTCIAFESGGDLTVAGTSTTIAAKAGQVICTSHAPLKADMAISDVDVPELIGLYKEATTKLSAFKRTALGMQGFAVAVNNSFYTALQGAQITAKLLSNSCSTTNSYSDAC